ncbi:gliding motility-associated C-terminal domain-containing protein [Flavobacterium sp. Arc3]|uniref:gliding motility-associated C-terminal domain-containing protein n=1 Tax=Flavobacterium sp. Arc3 TaxID=3046686 RepID=UPI00352E986D
MKNKLLLFLLFFSVVNNAMIAGVIVKNVNIRELYLKDSIISNVIDPVQKLKKTAKIIMVEAVLPPPSTIAGSSCGDGVNFVQVNVYANGVNGDEIIEWFSSQNSTSPLYTGFVYSPSIKTTKTYYVRSRSKTTAEISIRVPVVASVYLSPPSVFLTVSPGNSAINVLCPGTSVLFSAVGGGDLFEFSVEGAVQQAMSLSRTFTTSTLTNGQTVSVRTRFNKTIDGSMTESAWGTGPLEENSLSASLSPNASVGYINALKVSPEEDKLVFGIAGKVSKDISLLVFLDSKTGGFNVSNYGDVVGSSTIKGFNYFNNNPSTFDSYFQADYCLVISKAASQDIFFADVIELKSGESVRTPIGSAMSGSPSGVFGVNKNNAGTTDYNLGFEVEILKSLIGYTTGDIKFFAFTMQDTDESNYNVTNSFLSPETISSADFGSSAVDYNVKDPNPVVFSSSALTPCYTNAYFPVYFYEKPVASTVIQPTCSVYFGRIEILEQNGAEYSIDGINYQSSNVFTNLIPNSYTLYIRKASDYTCVNASEAFVIINEVTTPPSEPSAESVSQPTCNVHSGTILIAAQINVEYSLDGINYQASSVFTELAPDNYILYVRNIGDATCRSNSTSVVTINNIPIQPASPVSGGDQVVCELTPIQTLIASASVGSGELVVWYDSAAADNIVANPILDTVGTITYYAQAENNVTVCKSATRTAVTLTINPKAAEPVSGGDISECVMSPIQTLRATASVASGESLVWYNRATGGSIVVNPTLSSIGTITYYAQASTSINSCVNELRTAVTLTISRNPTKPVTGGSQVECSQSPLQTLTAKATVGSGESIVWYDAVSGGSVVASPILNSIGTVTYYAETVKNENGCISNTRTAVSLTINQKPISPIGRDSKRECALSPIQTLTAKATAQSGESVVWYDAATGGSVVASPTLNSIGTITYYAEAYNNVSACLSDSRTAVTLTINPNPVQPISGGDKIECALSTIQTLTATATAQAGESVVWYDASTGGNVVSNPLLSTLGTIIYYAESVNDATACVSDSRRAVSLTLNPKPLVPVSGGNQTVCASSPIQTLTATATAQDGVKVIWYDAITGGNVVSDPSLSSLGTVTYYAESIKNIAFCVSDSRAAVTLTINRKPLKPISGGDKIECSLSPIQNLTATATAQAGESVVWYDASTGGNIVSNPSLNTLGTIIYYAETVNNATSCVSVSRTAVSITINPSPALAVSGGNKTECIQNPIQTLTATATVGTGETLIWYTAATSGTVVSNPILSAVGNVTYYAESSNGTCPSLTRTAVSLSIVGVVPNPVGADQTVCSDGTTTQTLTATATAAGATITWYTGAIGGSVVVNPIQVGVGTKTFYAESSVGSCSSGSKTKVTLTIAAVPLKPTVISVSQPTCLTPTGTIAITAQTGVEYSIGNGFQDSPIFTLLVQGNYTPTVRFKNNVSCEIKGVAQTINLVPAQIQFEITGNCEGKDYVLRANALQNSYDSNNVVYEWKDNFGVTVGSNSNMLNVSNLLGSIVSSTIFPLTYSLKVSSASTGCETTNNVTVESIHCNIQKGISPDGNGMNESFDLRLRGVRKLEIFNRYGIKVYEQSNYTDQWKGQSNEGDNLPSATYYYVIEFNKGETKTGWIYLIREK